MTEMNRRRFVLTATAPLALAACGNGVENKTQKRIDARVDGALEFLETNVEGVRELQQKAAGVLVIPLMTKAGFGVGASYGRGALRINDQTVDYYSSAGASVGFQIGAQQYSHVLFFMTTDALENFRRASGWGAGADIEYAVATVAGNLSAETTTSLAPVVGVVFGQAGLIAGATVEGMKYTRIIP